MLLPRYHIRYHHASYFINAFKKSEFKQLSKRKVRILDAGCGTGELTLEIRQLFPNADLTACDINYKSLNSFKNKAKKNKITLINCDIGKLKFKSSYFDIITMFDVLEHVENPHKILSKLNRMLKPDGIFYLVIPTEADLFTIDGWLKCIFKINLKEKPIGHINQFTRQDINDSLFKNGFKISDVKYSYYFLYQFFSFIYYLYLHLTREGKYLQLVKKGKSGRFYFSGLLIIGGWLTNIETILLNKIPGQTSHIISRSL